MGQSAQCSKCSGEFSWSTPESAQQLFPLLCGEVFCSTCLGQRAREALSRRIAPLRCCQKVVPHDFIRMVLAYEEDVYYSFLLNQPRGEAESGKLPATLKKVASSPASPFLPRSVVAPIVIDDTEMKQPVTSLQNQVTTAGVTGTPTVGHQDEISLDETSTLPRYLTRGFQARRVQPQSSGGSVNAVSPATGILSMASSTQPCHLCGTKMLAVPFKAPCGHTLCLTCVKTGVRSYLDAPRSSSGAPVSCCGRLLPLDLVQRVIAGAELTRYAKVMVKYVDATKDTTVAGTKRKAESEAGAPVRKTAKGKAPANQRAPTKKMEQANDQNHVRNRECTACLSPVNLRARWFIGPCGHGYCRPCLTKMAKTSLANRGQVPIRCCSKEFPMDYVKSVLNKGQYGQYERYLAERDPRSSTLQSDQDYAKVVRQVKGKQCPVCGIGVVKVSGCNAMTCTLGHVFCWGCMHSKCTCGNIYRGG